MSRAPDPHVIDETVACLVDAAITRMVINAPDSTETERAQMELGLRYPSAELK